MQLAALVSVLLTLALLSYLYFGHFTRKVRVNGQIVPAAGVLKAVSPQFGRVVARRVSEGDEVSAGQVLYELSAERASDGTGIEGRIAAAMRARGNLLGEEKALQAQQLRRQEQSLLARGKIIENEMVRLEQQIVLQQDRIASADKMQKRFHSLREQGFVSEIQLSQADNDANDQHARRQALERDKLALAADLQQVRADAQQVSGQVRLNMAQSERALATLDQESAEQQGRSQIQVLAPGAGTVTALAFEMGQTVQAGAEVASVIPKGSVLEAHLLVPSRAIGFIEPGQNVLLRLSAFPYQKFGQAEGSVLRVEQSPLALPTAKMPGDGSAAEPIYRVVVKLAHQSVRAYGKEKNYQVGMTLEADIHQDHRRLIEWVIDPLISAAKSPVL